MAVWSEVHISALGANSRLDAEYYQPVFLSLEEKLYDAGASIKPLGELLEYCTNGSTPRHHDLSVGQVSFLTAEHISDFSIKFATDKRILLEYHDGEMKRTQLLGGEILITIKGRIGNAAVVSHVPHETNINQDVALLRVLPEYDPYYVAGYLNTHLGKSFIYRTSTGQINPFLSLINLQTIPVPIFADKRHINIGDYCRQAVQEAERLSATSASLYAEAGSILLHELGLGKLALSHRLAYEADFSEAMAAGRLDAEYFQPKYAGVIDALARLNPIRFDRLGNLLRTLTNGHTPRYHDLGVGEVPFLTAEHVFDFRIDFASEKRILREHHNGELKRTQLENGDMLVTIKGRIGNAAIVEDLQVDANINQDVALLRCKQGYHPYYVAGFINSIVGEALIEQACTGQMNPFLSLTNMQQILIPVFSDQQMNDWGEQIRERVNEANQAESRARHLLEDAKQHVEEMILSGE